MDPDRFGRPGCQFLNGMPAAPRGELAELQPNSRAVGVKARRAASLDPQEDEQDNSCQGVGDGTRPPCKLILDLRHGRPQNLPARKPHAPVAWVPRGATTMSGRKQAAPRNAFGRAAAPPRQLALSQHRSLFEPPIENAEPAAAGGGPEPTIVASSKPARKSRPATAARRVAADRGNRHEAPASEAKSVIHPFQRPRSRGASQRRKRPAPALEAPPAAGRSSPRARKSPEPHLASRAATPTLTTPTRPATAAAAISPELGLGLAQALSAELGTSTNRDWWLGTEA